MRHFPFALFAPFLLVNLVWASTPVRVHLAGLDRITVTAFVPREIDPRANELTSELKCQVERILQQGGIDTTGQWQAAFAVSVEHIDLESCTGERAAVLVSASLAEDMASLRDPNLGIETVDAVVWRDHMLFICARSELPAEVSRWVGSLAESLMREIERANASIGGQSDSSDEH